MRTTLPNKLFLISLAIFGISFLFAVIKLLALIHWALPYLLGAGIICWVVASVIVENRGYYYEFWL